MKINTLAETLDALVHPDRPLTLVKSNERNHPLVILDGYAIVRITELNAQPAWTTMFYAPQEGEVNVPVLAGTEATPDRLSAIKAALARGFQYIY
ncbi:MAG: hypothetical protein ACXWQ5_00690 [Ktedonobacterales bacterium]